MDTIKQFGQDGTYYQFPYDQQVSLQGDFGDTLPDVVRLAGLDGSYNTMARSRPRSAVGNVQLIFWLFAETAAEMATARNNVLKMLGWGHKRLFKTLGDGTLVWTWAIVNNLRMPQSARDLPHKQQQVTVNFQCDKSRWYGASGYVLNTDGSVTDGTTAQVNGTSVTNGSTVNVTNNGTAPAGCYIKWVTGVGVTVTNPTISRDEGAVTVNSVQYTDTVAQSTTIEIDGRNHTLSENMSVTPTYGKLTTTSADWLEIPPGTHTLDIAGTFSAGVALTVKFWDTYF